MCQWLVTVVGVVFMINIARESQVRTWPVWDWCFLCRHSYTTVTLPVNNCHQSRLHAFSWMEET